MLNSAQELYNIIEFILRKNGAEMEVFVRDKMQEFDLQATGRGLDSVASVVDGDTLSIMGEDYLLALDDGQEAGTIARMEDLIEWATARGLAPAENIESFAAGVQQAIYKNGTIKRFGYQGTNFLKFAIDEYLPRLAGSIEEEIAEALEKGIIDKINRKDVN